MSAESLFLKELADAMRRSLPEIVYLFDAFVRRKAQKFRAISQQGTKFKRVTLTLALVATSGLVSYVLYRLDPYAGLEGIMPPAERAFWTAVVPLIAALLAYWLMRWTVRESTAATFINLGLVTCIALTAIPGVISLAGANASALASDIRQFRAGRGAGTSVHQIVCTTLQEQAESQALMRRLMRNSRQLLQNGRLLNQNTQLIMENTGQLQQNRQRLEAVGQRLMESGDPRTADISLHIEFGNGMRAGLEIMRRGMEIQRQGHALRERGLALHREGFAIHDRELALQMRQTTAPYRLLGAYPVAAGFLIVAIIAGVLMWVFSAVIAWKLVVTPQPTRRRKAMVGTVLVTVFLLVSAGLSLLRSGLVEVWVQELPTHEMLEARLRIAFESAAPMCGPLNNYGLW